MFNDKLYPLQISIYILIESILRKYNFYDVPTIFRWQKCVSVASSDNKGFGMAAGHAYIKKTFDDDSRRIVGSYFFLSLLFYFDNLVLCLAF